MSIKKLLVSAMVAAGMIGAYATPLTPLSSAVAADIYVKVAPPAPRAERVPPPRRGYVWSPGYWQWNGKRNRHVWVAGTWQRARPGYAYTAPRWEERNGRWHYQASRWDRDGDGIPNKRDATPDGRKSDKDRDGVPDRRDNYPNNPSYR